MQPNQDEFLETLYREHFAEIQVHAYRYVGQWERAQAVAQETFYIACKKIDIVMESPNPVGWLKNTAKNVAYNMIRERTRQFRALLSIEEIVDETTQENMPLSEESLIEEYSAYVSKEDIILLKRITIDDEPYIDVAKSMGISMWACRKRVQRICAKLREQLEKEK